MCQTCGLRPRISLVQMYRGFQTPVPASGCQPGAAGLRRTPRWGRGLRKVKVIQGVRLGSK